MRSIIALAALAMVCTTVVADTDWAAVFLTAEDQQRLCNNYLVPFLPSSNKVFCEHMTLRYGGDLSPFRALSGRQVNITALAYGQDEHGQAVLGHLMADWVHSDNNFTHITVSVSGQGPYSAVYSNFLWQRFTDEVPLSVERGDDGQIHSVTLPGEGVIWSGVLPPWDKYDASDARMQLIPFHRSAASSSSSNSNAQHHHHDHHRRPRRDDSNAVYRGTICLNSTWDATTFTCNV